MTGFIFYRSFMQALDGIPDADRLALYDAVVHYALLDEEPSFEQGYCFSIFSLIRPQLDANRQRYDAGKASGAKRKASAKKATAERDANDTGTEAERDANDTGTKKKIKKEKENKNKNEIEKEKIKRFTPPTSEEVNAYCLESGYRIDAERFIDYYESNGWMVGRHKMKDWKAAVRNWSMRDDEKPKKEEYIDPNANVDLSWAERIGMNEWRLQKEVN